MNCDGEINEIKGINKGPDDTISSLEQPLPENLGYSWIISDELTSLGGDHVVDLKRQWLYFQEKPFPLDITEKILIHKAHWNEPEHYESIVRGLDEPDTKELSYGIQFNEKYHVFATYQMNRGYVDEDWFHFSINQSNIVRFRLDEITEQIDQMSARLYRKMDHKLISEHYLNSGQKSLEFYSDSLTDSDYYLQITSTLPSSGSESWKHPFTLEIDYLGVVSKLFTYTIPPSIEADNVSLSTLHTEIQDPYGNLVGTATDEATYTILSGGDSGTLVGDNPAQAEGGIATIQVRATNQPGQVTIECSSPELISDTVTVYTYETGATTEVSGHINQNTTWSLANSPYEVTGDVVINEGSVLTIKPGVVVKFRNNTDIYVKGGFISKGTSYNPIIFTSTDKNLPGSWGGIRFESSALDDYCELNYCEFYYAGDNTFNATVEYPIVVNLNANPFIKNTQIKNSRINAVALLGGTYSSDITVDNPDLPLWLTGDLAIGEGAVLTIAPGCLFKMNDNRDIYVRGGLKAVGHANDPIIFTSYKDDARGGDSNGDGSSAPLPGNWGGIRFESTVLDNQCELSYCEFYYAGDNTFNATVEYPIVVNLNANPFIKNTQIKNSRINAVALLGGTYSSDITVDNPDLPLWLTGDLAIGEGAVLTIAPGCLFKMNDNRDIYVRGGLKAVGHANDPIIFTSYKDDARGGDSNGDGSSAPLPGNWGGIRFESTVLDNQCELSYCEFYYAGDNTFNATVEYPIVVNLNANPFIKNTQIKNSRINAVALLGGTYSSDITVDNPDLPLWLTGDLAIGEGAVLTIAPGCLFKMNDNRDIYVRGGLKAVGHANDPIIFTSYKDDARGGDSNGDGSSAPLPGNWGGIRFESTALDNHCALSYCELYYGGDDSFNATVGYPLVIISSEPKIQFLKIEHSKTHGIFNHDTGSPDLGGGTRGSAGNNKFYGFFESGKYAVYNNSTNDIYAKYNYWGTDNPGDVPQVIYDKNDNSGKGEVIFEPIILRNTAPQPFSLVSPSDSDTIRSHITDFIWKKPLDAEDNIVSYDLYLSNFWQDTLVTGITDTSYTFDGSSYFREYNTYEWNVIAHDHEFSTAGKDTFRLWYIETTDLSTKIPVMPKGFRFISVYPNPFNPQTTFYFALPKRAHINISIYNLLGKKVATVMDKICNAGEINKTWSANQLSTGVYFAVLQKGRMKQVRKIVYLK